MNDTITISERDARALYAAASCWAQAFKALYRLPDVLPEPLPIEVALTNLEIALALQEALDA